MTKRYHHGDLRAALIQKTLEMVKSNELHLVGFRELARRLDVSRSAPYRHFESADHLLAAVAEDGFRSFLASLRRVENDGQWDDRRKFLELGVCYVEFALQNPAHYRLMFDHKFYQFDDYSDLQSLSKQSFEVLRGTAKKCLPPSPQRGAGLELATLAWSCVHGLSKLFIDGQLNHVVDRGGFIRNSCEKLLGAIGN